MILQSRALTITIAALAMLVLCACQSGSVTPGQPAAGNTGGVPATPAPAGADAEDTFIPTTRPGDRLSAELNYTPRCDSCDEGCFGLKTPGELSRHRGSTVYSTVINAADFDPGLPNHNVDIAGTSLQLTPGWTGPGSAAADLACALYRVSLTDYTGDSLASLGWMVPPTDLTDTWLGLGNLTLNRWDWFSAANPGVIDLPPLAPYTAENDEMLVALVLTGTAECRLFWLRLGGPQPPTAALNASPQTGRAPLEVTLDAAQSSDNDGEIIGYSWDLDGDGGFELDSGLQPSVAYTFESPGIYEPAVRVQDNDLLFDQQSIQVNVTSVFNQSPTASLAVTPDSGEPPLTVTLDAGLSSDSDGEIISYDWDFEGDGTYDELTTTATTNHRYDDAGIYHPTVRVTDNEFATGTASVEITVAAEPVAELTVIPAEGNAPLGLDLDASGSHVPGGSISDYDWDFEGDGIYDTTTVVPYAQKGMIDEGEYPCRVRVNSLLGATDTATVEPAVQVRGWSRSFGGANADYFNAICADGQGALIGGGNTLSYGAGSYDGLLIKLDLDGGMVWARTWGASGTDSLYDVVADTVGNVYLTGYTYNFAPGGEADIFVAKFSSSGNLAWTRTWGRDRYDWANDMALDGLGGVIAVGETVNEVFTSMDDIVVVKYDVNGNLAWAKTFNSSREDTFPFVTCDALGNIIITGRSVISSHGIQGNLIKISPAGELLSQQHWGGYHQEGFYRSFCGPDGSLFITGFTKSYGDTDGDALLVKLTPAGNFDWARVWSTDSPEVLTAAHLGSDGLLYACGIHETAAGAFYGFVLAMTTTGEFVSANLLATTAITRLWDGISLGNDTFVMAGSTEDAYGTWLDFPGTFSSAEVELADIEGELIDAGGTVSSPTATTTTPGFLTTNTGGGNLDALAITFRTPAAE